MSVPYHAPVEDMLFALNVNGQLEQLQQLPAFAESSDDLVEAVLNEAARVASEILAPINYSGNETGARLDGDNVITADGWQQAYQAFQEGGWMGIAFDPEHGGQGMPNAIATAVNESWQAANMAFSLCPLLTQGAIEALVSHGSESLNARFLTKLVEGSWTGTMNLTEPQAGSDLALVRTSATPEDDHYLIKGQKIFITYGDHDLTENIAHLVLARLPDAPEGVKGISLFLVPKFLLNENGELGRRNDVKCIKLEEKLGIHGSPTCVLSFGDESGAVGYLVGEPHAGLACMFTMMNNARHSVGVQGLAVSERSFQQALAYAQERVQSNPAGSDEAHAAIINHPDVKRMLMLMKSSNEAMRGLCYWHASCMDLAQKSEDETVCKENHNLLEFLTPIVKGWCTELANELTSYGVQVHGGMGYIEETGAAQHYRDARITAIYEGTTAIQANDLIGRKLLRDEGEVAQQLIDAGFEFVDKLEKLSENRSFAIMKTKLRDVMDEMTHVTEWMLEHGKQEPALVAAASTNYLMLCGLALSGLKLIEQAVYAQERLNSEAQVENEAFLRAKISTAEFYASQMLPRGAAYEDIILHGSSCVIDAPLELSN